MVAWRSLWELGASPMLAVLLALAATAHAGAADGARPRVGGHLAVVDPGAKYEWDLWDARKDGGVRSPSAGAALDMSGNAVAPAGTAGGDAANLPLLGGIVRPEEILQGPTSTTRSCSGCPASRTRARSARRCTTTARSPTRTSSRREPASSSTPLKPGDGRADEYP